MFAWAALFIGLIITLVVSNNIRQQIEDEAANAFNIAADQVTLRIEERLLSYALLLRGAAGLFYSSDQLTREEWRIYVDNLQLDKNLAGVQGIGFSEWVPADKLSAHQQRVRSEGFPDYQIFPVGERETYSSIVYLEPFSDRNLLAFGYDMYSDPVRRAAMERARDLNDASLSGRVELVQEDGTNEQAGTLIYVPVYRHGADISTESQRRDALIGWAYSPFRMTDLMNGIIGDWARVNMDVVGLRIYDNAIASPENLMFASPALSQRATTPTLLQQRTLEIHGHNWLLEFEALAGHLTLGSYAPVRRTFVSGTLLSALLFALMLAQLRTRQRAEMIASKLTEEMRNNQIALHAAHVESERFQKALDAIHSYIYIKDANLQYLYANSACLEYFKVPLHRLRGMKDEDLFPTASWNQVRLADKRALAGENVRDQIEVITDDNQRHVFLDIKSPIYDADEPDRVSGVLGIATDITNLQQMAHYDALTGLPNRVLLSDRLHQALVHANRHKTQIAVVYLDLDRFKAVNDELGHEAGDKLLRRLAARMQAAVREGDTVARIGGDEFVVILPDIEGVEQLTPILKRLMSGACEQIPVQNGVIQISASLGVRFYNPAESLDSQLPTGAGNLLREADQAMYHAKNLSKKSGKNCASLFVSDGPAVCILQQDISDTWL